MIFKPARCTMKLPSDLESPQLVGEEKLDGARYILYVGYDPTGRTSGTTLLSRRESKKDGLYVDKTANIPHIIQEVHRLQLPVGTVFDGEILARDCAQTNGIMNCNPDKSLQRQLSEGFVRFHIFDILAMRFSDSEQQSILVDNSMSVRRAILAQHFKNMPFEPTHLQLVPQYQHNLEGLFNTIVADGGEGIVVKDTSARYGAGWAKMKKSYDVSLIISGKTSGEGKYQYQLGALCLSVYHDGRLIEVARCSGMTDSQRLHMTKHFEAEYLGKAIDVFAQEIQKPTGRSDGNPIGRLRHCTFHRLRPDISPESLTSTKLKEDLEASKAAGKRSK